MPTLRLNARTVKALKPKTSRIEYFDALVPGLALRVTPTGGKSWSVLYRHRGRLRRLTLGSASVIPLATARERARDHLHDSTKGLDPAAQKKADKQAETIADLAALYISKWAKPHKKSWKDDDRILRAEVLPRWQHRAIADIRRRDVRVLVEGIAERGAPILANRVVSLISKMFRVAVEQDLIDASPAVKITRPGGTEKARERVLTEDELRTLWTACEALDPAMGAFYQLRLLTAQRGGEVAGMRWRDVDLKTGWWTIPATSAKNKLTHRVPLSRSVLALLETLKPTTIDGTAFVLAGARSKRLQAAAAATFEIKDFRGHDLRRTAASLMAGGGIPRLTISKILNHVETSVTAIYDRYGYDAEKAAALAWWDVKLRAILDNADDAKVLAFASRA